MPAALRLSLVAPVLTVLFALSTIALLLMSRPVRVPRLFELTPVQATVVERTSGLVALLGEPRLRLTTGGGERTVPVGGCAAGTAGLRPGEAITVWLDREPRMWRVARGPTPLCTYVHATQAVDSRRRTTRVVALSLAVAGIVCAALTLVRRRG